MPEKVRWKRGLRTTCGILPNFWNRMELPKVKENDMGPMKVSWHEEGSQLASGWIESGASRSYHPAWMQSSYPDEANASRSSPDQSAPSPFGKPRLLTS